MQTKVAAQSTLISMDIVSPANLSVDVGEKYNTATDYLVKEIAIQKKEAFKSPATIMRMRSDRHYWRSTLYKHDHINYRYRSYALYFKPATNTGGYSTRSYSNIGL